MRPKATSQTSHAPEADAPGPTIRASALIFVDRRLLLVQQRRGEEAYWLLPGGGVRFGERLAQALRREVAEELGMEIAVGRPLAFLESISPDLEAYAKHVFHVVLTAELAHAASVADLEQGLRPDARDPAILDSRAFTSAEVHALDLRPPIADFLLDCFATLPPAALYLGVRW